jgi:hypothetical protein
MAEARPQSLYLVSYIKGYNMKEAILMKGKDVLRYPRLDTVLMVEQSIREHDGELKKRKLWESLPKKMMYQTFCVAINYLMYAHRISIDAEGKVGWIHYPELARKYTARKDLSFRK